MLDPEIFDKLVPFNNYIVVPRVRPLNKDTLTDEQVMTVSTLLFGFSLGDKIWGKLDFLDRYVSQGLNWKDRVFRRIASFRRYLE